MTYMLSNVVFLCHTTYMLGRSDQDCLKSAENMRERGTVG